MRIAKTSRHVGFHKMPQPKVGKPIQIGNQIKVKAVIKTPKLKSYGYK